MKLEKKYDFRKKLLEIHEKDIRNNLLIPEANEFEFKNNSTVYFEEDDIVIKTAAEDFCDYLKTSMGISASTTDSQSATVKICSAEKHNIDLKDANGYKGFMFECTDDGVNIYYYDNRGAAQALYYLEDLMTFRKAPFIPKETVYRKPIFAPRMTHSGYGLDIFPDEHLAQMAHEGFDVVLLFVKEYQISFLKLISNLHVASLCPLIDLQFHQIFGFELVCIKKYFPPFRLAKPKNLLLQALKMMLNTNYVSTDVICHKEYRRYETLSLLYEFSF